MPFIGNQPATSFEAVKKDRFTNLTGTSVTLSHAVSTVQDIVLWINAVKQDYTSYSVSGTALTVGGSLISSDIVEVAYLGRTFQTVNPPAGSVGASQISDGSISLGKLSATGTKSSSTFLRGDNSFQEVPAGGITQADQWRITADVTSNTNPISSNLERVDGTAFNYIGTGMSVSSGTWTFPSTGIYHVAFTVRGYMSTSDTASGFIEATTDNSSYNRVAEATWGQSGSSRSNTATCETFVDVTDTANVKVRFGTGSMASGTVLESDTNYNRTCFTFIRLGDT